jgi:hypothetical protein
MEWPAMMCPTAGVGAPAEVPPALTHSIAIVGAGIAGYFLGHALGGKEFAVTGAIVGPVAALVVMARPPAGT